MEEEKQEVLEDSKVLEEIQEEEKQEVLEKIKTKKKPVKKVKKKTKKKIILEEPKEVLDEVLDEDGNILYYIIVTPLVCYGFYQLGKYVKNKFTEKKILEEE